MWITILIISYCFTQKCSCLNLIDLPSVMPEVTETLPVATAHRPQGQLVERRSLEPRYPPIRTTLPMRRGQSSQHWVFRQNEKVTTDDTPMEDEMKDIKIKNKIQTLVQATLHDIDRKTESIQTIKEMYRDQAPYKIGFILSMIKKSRDVLNELFDVAIKHRDTWKALEQLKVLELIVHTNVDTTNLVRQLVEIHIQHYNSSNFLRDAYLLSQKCSGLYLIDLPISDQEEKDTNQVHVKRRNMNPSISTISHAGQTEQKTRKHKVSRRQHSDLYDTSMKVTIEKLVGQAIYDVQRSFRSIEIIRNVHRPAQAYKIGFVISMIRKEIDMMNELFHLGMKYKDNKYNLRQLRIIEFVVHTSVDISHMVRQVNDLHTNTTIRKRKVH